MSEQTKPSKSLSERIISTLTLYPILDAKYSGLLSEVSKLTEDELKAQKIGWKYTHPRLDVDEKTLITNYITDPLNAQNWMDLTEKKIACKKLEDELYADALAWHARTQTPIPKKPVSGSLSLNKKGMQEMD